MSEAELEYLPSTIGVRGGADDVVLLAIARNEILRMPFFLEYYRSRGVTDFVIIDNCSNDGTFEYLQNQVDVSVVHTTLPYKVLENRWRNDVANKYFNEKWVLFADIDELLIFPGDGRVGLPALCRWWRDHEAYVVPSPMIDMYSNRPLENVEYIAGSPFWEAADRFDTHGYRLVQTPEKTPSFVLLGGPRERFFREERNGVNSLQLTLESWFFSHRSRVTNKKLKRFVRRFLKRKWPKDPPCMVKVPLIYWKKGLKVSAGAHFIDGTDIYTSKDLSEDWCPILHFKYFQDFKRKCEIEADRNEHWDNAKEYKTYNKQMSHFLHMDPTWKYSSKYSGYDSLLPSGLARRSASTRNFIETYQE